MRIFLNVFIILRNIATNYTLTYTNNRSFEIIQVKPLILFYNMPMTLKIVCVQDVIDEINFFYGSLCALLVDAYFCQGVTVLRILLKKPNFSKVDRFVFKTVPKQI